MPYRRQVRVAGLHCELPNHASGREGIAAARGTAGQGTGWGDEAHKVVTARFQEYLPQRIQDWYW